MLGETEPRAATRYRSKREPMQPSERGRRHAHRLAYAGDGCGQGREPAHPAILQLVHLTARAGKKNGIWTGVCGEMASDLTMVPLLRGLGVDELSVSPAYLPQVKFLIRQLDMKETRELAGWALECESGSEILARAQEFVRRVAPRLFDGTAR